MTNFRHGMPRDFRPDGSSEGSAIVSVLVLSALLCAVLVSLLNGVRIDRRVASLASSRTQARLAAESAVSSAMARLALCTATNPAFVVGLQHRGEAAPALVLAHADLSSEARMVPLFSCDSKPLSNYPSIPADYALAQLSNSLSTNPSLVVDINDPDLISMGSAASTNRVGLLAPEGRYPVLWQYLRDTSGKAVARYAYALTYEASRLNPLLHRGAPRNEPQNWDSGPSSLPLTNASGSLLQAADANRLKEQAAFLPTLESYAHAFADEHDFLATKHLLTAEPCLLPDIIPAGYPEGGLPKYNLNDLVTNQAWGATPYARATNIATIIERNLPKFKTRDPSLPTAQATLYLQRLACSIVDYISSSDATTGPSPEIPLGRGLIPYVTQIAECCTRKNQTSNSVTIESRFYVEVWNPTTSPIPAGGTARLTVGNRARVSFGTGIVTPFDDYDGVSSSLPEIRPNELLVISFPPTEQSWTSPTATTSPPTWNSGPSGNADGTSQQPFFLRWNGMMADRTRPAGISPGDREGGLKHLGGRLTNGLSNWQCMTVPTYSARSDHTAEQDEADEAIATGSYRAVGDPRQNILTSYVWEAVSDYPRKSRWKGVNPAAASQAGAILDPQHTWTRRDPVPLNPPTGNRPAGISVAPDAIASPYDPGRDAILAPSVVRKGAMRSIGELGNIYDPAQADDSGEAPKTGGTGRSNPFGCGGGRTLRFGQPEFHVATRKNDWDLPGKRALDLVDLFTVNDPARKPGASSPGTDSGIPGRINVNTASHAVLTSLFTGVSATSDRRFPDCVISATSVEKLASLVEEHRPFNRLSDLGILTTNLVNAETYLPNLSRNLPGSSPPAADVFDRAREEAFARIIGHCSVQSRTFRIVAVGQALDTRGNPLSTEVTEGIISLAPDAKGRLVPDIHRSRWY